MSSQLESLGLSIKRLQHRHHRAMEIRLAPLGVSLVQWNALREIDRNPGASQHRLAELTFNSDQAFGTLISRLLRLKLVERRPGAGRATLHRLTSKGEALLRQGRGPFLGVLANSFAPLNEEERVALMSLLEKLLSTDNLAPPRSKSRANSRE